MVKKGKLLFCVRCVFKHTRRQYMNKKYLYEERLTICKTDNEDKAIELAEKDAALYEKQCDCKYLKVAQSYAIYGNQFKNGLEIFSLMRESDFSKDAYIDRHFDTSGERQRKEVR